MSVYTCGSGYWLATEEPQHDTEEPQQEGRRDTILRMGPPSMLCFSSTGCGPWGRNKGGGFVTAASYL